MKSDTAARAVIVALLALTLYLLFRIFSPFLGGITWALVLAVVLWPVQERLAVLLWGRRRLAAVLIAIAAALLVIVPAVIAAVQIAGGLTDAYAWVHGKVEAGLPVSQWFPEFPQLTRAIEWGEARLDLEKFDLRAMLSTSFERVGKAAAAGVGALVNNIVQTLLFVVVFVAMLATFLERGPDLVERLERYLPLGKEDRQAALTLLRDTTRGVFVGVLLTALVQGALGGIGFAFVGLPNAITFGGMMFLCALLPGGTAIVWGPAVIFLFATGHPWKAGILLVWSVLVVSSVDNVLRPMFIGRGVKLPVMLIFFGTLGGMLAFGLIGLFTGPLVITIFLFLLEVVRRDFFRAASQGAEP